MRIGIVGGGFGGLVAGWELSRRGYRVVVFEKERYLGGLASSFKRKNWRWGLDRFYRHIFFGDTNFLRLTEALGVRDKVFFRRPKTSVYYRGKIYPFDTPLDLLSFSPLSFFSRWRLGAGMAFLKASPFFSCYYRKGAEELLLSLVGQEAYRLVWEPLLRQKFGPLKEKIPFSWFWARIKTRTGRLGYFQGGFARLADLIAQEIKRRGGEVKIGSGVEKIRKTNEKFILKSKGKIYYFDKVILTTPLPVCFSLAEPLLRPEKRRFSFFKTLGAAVLILRLKEKLLPDRTYWLNILSSRWPFVVVVEQTNFIEKKFYGGEHLVYLGGYYPPHHPIFSWSKKKVEKEFFPFVRRLNPEFERMILGTDFFTNLWAQPVPEKNRETPSFATSTAGLYWLTMHHISPWDRGINFTIEFAQRLVREIEKDQ